MDNTEIEKYDKKLDEKIYETETRFDNQKIKIGILSYNKEEAKLQITREIYNDFRNCFAWTKLGRLNKKESEALIKMLKESLEKF